MFSKVKLFYKNTLSGLTASSEQSGYPASNLLDGLEGTFWKPNTVADHTVLFDAGAGLTYTADYLALGNHDLHTRGATVKLQTKGEAALTSSITGDIRSLVKLTDLIYVAGVRVYESGSYKAKIYRSLDSGASWTLIGELGYNLDGVYSLIHLGSGVVLAGTGSAYVYRSTDWGGTWSVAQRLGTGFSIDCFCAPAVGTVLAGTRQAGNGQIFRSTDAGLNWTSVYTVGEVYIHCMAVLDANTIVAGTGNNYAKMYKSTDAGVNWTLKETLGGIEFACYSLLALDANTVLAGSKQSARIYRSTNAGDSYSLIGTIPSGTNVWSLAELGSGVIIAGLEGGYIYRSENDGVTWDLAEIVTTGGILYEVMTTGTDTALCGNQAGKFWTYTDDWSDVFAPFAPANDKALVKEFTSRSRRQWQLVITGSTGIFRIAMALWGQAVELGYAEVGFDPTGFKDNAVVNISRTGILQGISNTYRERQVDFKFRFCDDTAYAKKQHMIDNVGLGNLFVGWETGSHPTEVFVMRSNPQHRDPITTRMGKRQITYSFVGRME